MSGKTRWHVAELIMSDRFPCELHKCSSGNKKREREKVEGDLEKRESGESSAVRLQCLK